MERPVTAGAVEIRLVVALFVSSKKTNVSSTFWRHTSRSWWLPQMFSAGEGLPWTVSTREGKRE